MSCWAAWRGCSADGSRGCRRAPYVDGLMSDTPRKNAWSPAERAGDRTPDRMQRLGNHAVGDEHEAMGIVRDFVARAPGRPGRGRSPRRDRAGEERRAHRRGDPPVRELRRSGHQRGQHRVLPSTPMPEGHAQVASASTCPRAEPATRSAALGRAWTRTSCSRPSRSSPSTCTPPVCCRPGPPATRCTAATRTAGLLRRPRGRLRARGALLVHRHAERPPQGSR